MAFPDSACHQLTAPGQLGALLRLEGLYSSHLSMWRKQQDEAALAGLVPKRRGRKPDPNAALVAEDQRLVRENAKLMRKLRRTEAMLADAHARHPERFVHRLPRPLTPAAEIWINPPENKPHVRTPELPRDSTFVPQVSQSH